MILRNFPNTTTVVVENIVCVRNTHALPDTVRFLTLEQLDSQARTVEQLPFANRDAAIRRFGVSFTDAVNLFLFPNLQRVMLGAPNHPTLAQHRLKRLTVGPQKDIPTRSPSR